MVLNHRYFWKNHEEYNLLLWGHEIIIVYDRYGFYMPGLGKGRQLFIII